MWRDQKMIISVGEDLVLSLLAVSTPKSRLGTDANMEIFQRVLKGTNNLDPINVSGICSPPPPASSFLLEKGCRLLDQIHLVGAIPGSSPCDWWGAHTASACAALAGSLVTCGDGLYQASAWASLFRALLFGYFSSIK